MIQKINNSQDYNEIIENNNRTDDNLNNNIIHKQAKENYEMENFSKSDNEMDIHFSDSENYEFFNKKEKKYELMDST